MKQAGIIILITGLCIIFFSLTMDTSVKVEKSKTNSLIEMPDRVNNLGLMNDKQNYLILGGILTIVGTIMIGFSVKTENNIEKKCPRCAELVKSDANICRFYNYSFEDAENFQNVTCSFCLKEVILDEVEIYKKEFICPDCNELNKNLIPYVEKMS